jgi:adenylate cyclase
LLQLADQLSFWLGEMEVRPSLREVRWPGGRETLQPRAMQVLALLAASEGVVVSRDQLLAKCWGQRGVSDDSINRVIHLLRDLEARSGGCGFSIQTVSKVGYRLVATLASKTPLLAVLAFDNLTGDPDLGYFSDGVSEEILHTVSRTTGLKVVGRSSSFALRGADKAAGRVAEFLGATHLLDGSVRRAGDRLRITAQLEACATRTPLWADRFDRSLADIFAVQDEIAAAVAAALNVAFAPSPAAEPIDPVAYDLFLRAREPGLEWLVPDVALLEQAVARAPGFAKAWALLAFGRAMALRWNMAGAPDAEQRAAVADAAHRALVLDAAAGSAWLALATIEPICGRFGEQRALSAKALAAAPNDAAALTHACGLDDIVGRQRRAFAAIARAYELDPRMSGWYHGYMLQALGRVREADANFDRDLARWPDVISLNIVALGCAYERDDWLRYDLLLSRVPEALTISLLIASVRTTADRLRAWSDADTRDSLEEMRQNVRQTGTTGLTLAGILCARGETDAVYDILETASFSHLFEPQGSLPLGEWGLNVIFNPRFSALRRDIRFVRLCARLGLCDFWATTGEWPDCAEEVAPWYDFEAEARRILNADRAAGRP